MPLSFVYRIRNLLLGIRSVVLDLDPAKVKVYCDETIDQYYALFPWAPMNPFLHMLLAHLPEFLEIGFLIFFVKKIRQIEARSALLC